MRVVQKLPLKVGQRAIFLYNDRIRRVNIKRVWTDGNYQQYFLGKNDKGEFRIFNTEKMNYILLNGKLFEVSQFATDNQE